MKRRDDGTLPGEPLARRKEELLVQELIRNPEKTNAEIAEAAGYHGKNKKALTEATRVVLKRARVRERLTELLEEKYPNYEEDFTKVVKRGMMLAGKTEDLDKLTNFLDKFARLAGYSAPTKSMSLNATLPKLPGSDDSSNQ